MTAFVSDAHADQEGLHLPRGVSGAFHVVFDGVEVWQVQVERGQRLLRWPAAIRPYLDGTAEVALVAVRPDAVPARVDLGRARFGDSDEPVRFIDKLGRPVVIDKWGLPQTPFSARGAEVRVEMVELASRLIEAVREESGLEAWLAFGSLLGAMRSGEAIGHDSDMDLLYLSRSGLPADINLEIYRLKRALARRGFNVILRTGSFLTVKGPTSEGAPVTIDIYSCFYVGDLLHETATVRAPVPQDAILPLRTLPFEGAELPAPARPEVLLEASYGPGWRVPDPSFQHEPGPEITERFHAWFGDLFAHRRAWELWWEAHQEPQPPSDLARRVRAEIPLGSRVLDVGTGSGGDPIWYAHEGYQAVAMDYARGALRQAKALHREQPMSLSFSHVNLYDLRDVLSYAALRRRTGPPDAIVARRVVEYLQPRGVTNLLLMMRMLLRGGGVAYVELGSRRSRAEHEPAAYPVSLDGVQDQLRSVGAEIEDVAEAGSGSTVVARWR